MDSRWSRNNNSSSSYGGSWNQGRSNNYGNGGGTYSGSRHNNSSSNDNYKNNQHGGYNKQQGGYSNTKNSHQNDSYSYSSSAARYDSSSNHHHHRPQQYSNKRDSEGEYKQTLPVPVLEVTVPPKSKNKKKFYGPPPMESRIDDLDPKVMQVKDQVDQHLRNICLETWNDHVYTHKIISQLPPPDFIREYQVSSVETISSMALSLQAMEDQLGNILPHKVLQFDKDWLQQKVDAMFSAIDFVQTQPEFGLDPDNIVAFFEMLPCNLVFDAGFHALGISTMDEKMCFCPCGYKMKPWHAQFHLDFMKKHSRDDYCSDRKFRHIDLMFHIDTVAKLENVNGLLHRGLSHYLRLLYKSYNGGRGHKALFHIGDKDYKEIEAYENKSVEQLKKQLQEQLDNEEKKRLEVEGARKAMEQELKELGLYELNKDKFDTIQDLSKNLNDMALEMKPKVNRLPEEYEAAKRNMESIFHCLRKKYCLKRKQRVKIPAQFSLQQLLDDWYDHPDHDVLNLFKPIENSNQLIEFLNEWNVEVVEAENFFEDQKKKSVRKNYRKAKDCGEPKAQFLSNVWMQVGDLAIQVMNEKYVQLFEPTKGGLLMVTEDQIKETISAWMNDSTDADGLYTMVLEKAKTWYRAIGRIMIHSLITKSDMNLSKQQLIPSYIVPRFYRNIIFRSCGPEDKNLYSWAEVVNDLREIERGSVIDMWIDQKHSPEKIFTQLIPEKFIKGRNVFIDAFKEGVTIGGVIDIAGLMLKDIPLLLRGMIDFTAVQMGKLLTTFPRSSTENQPVPFFKSLDLDVLDSVIFGNGSVTAEDIAKILRVRFWEFKTKEQVAVPPQIVNNQKKLFRQIGSVIVECSNDDYSFPSRFIEFFTGFAYLPIVEESQSHEVYPQPDGKNFELVIEFIGDESIDSESLPVARTFAKTMKLPGTAYNGDASVFKEKLLESLMSMPGMKSRFK